MEPVISICCITYNHEKYISDALNSFLMQELSFPYEIIVHDDASNDKTPEIIRGYEKKYPEIIRSIYQKENQYSKGKKPLTDFLIPLVRGKYIAICEGDDYWTDTRKLQKQVEFLNNNLDYVMCFHKVKVVDVHKKFLGLYYGLSNEGSKEIKVKDAAKGGIIHASSKLIRSDFYKKSRPDWLKNARHGDYSSALYTAAEGKVYYIDEVMSAYRSGVENSIMTNRKKNFSKESAIKYHLNRIETLVMADVYYDYKYHDEIEQVNLISEVIIALLGNDFSGSAMTKYKNYIAKNGLAGFIKLLLLKKCPFIAKILLNVRGKITLEKTNRVN